MRGVLVSIITMPLSLPLLEEEEVKEQGCSSFTCITEASEANGCSFAEREVGMVSS